MLSAAVVIGALKVNADRMLGLVEEKILYLPKYLDKKNNRQIKLLQQINSHSFWWQNVHNTGKPFRGLSLPSKSVLR